MKNKQISVDDLEKYNIDDLPKDTVIVLDHDDIADPDEYWEDVMRSIKELDE